ncbi:MAG: hypothetical protein C0478_04245 [Planctomyces sp.]|nr:hypothetical protein [Planctomyces sp.]
MGPTTNTPSANLRADYQIISIDRLRAGATLRSPLYDADKPSFPLLLAAGTKITTQLLELIARRGIKFVHVHKSELDNVSGPGKLGGSVRGGTRTYRPSTTPAQSTSPSGPKWTIRADSFIHDVSQRGAIEPSPVLVREVQQGVERSLAQLKDVFLDIGTKGKVNTNAVTGVARQNLILMTRDIDLFAENGSQPVLDRYPMQHGLKTSMLATAMATIMGFRRDDLLDLSFGCLIHDSGMLKVAQRLKSDRRLNAGSQLEIMKHPIYICDLLSKEPLVTHGAKLVAYQMHERLDGSGYPRQRMGNQIHPLSRIAAVADTYLALISPRPHRAGISPYAAIEHLLEGTRGGQFDSQAVRALLHLVSLFPVGSLVQLNDGRTARVVLANRERFAEPTVRIETPSASSDIAGESINLSRVPHLRIVKSLANDLPQWSDVRTGDEW